MDTVKNKYRIVVTMRHQPTVLVGMWDELDETEYSEYMQKWVLGLKTADGITLYEDDDTAVFIHPDDISYIRMETHK